MPAPVLAVRRLTKRFSGVVALRDVAFEVAAGEIHALCGENGAGKSTLIKLLGGIHPAGTYEGEILVDGQVMAFRDVRDAEQAGIAVIHQELALIDELSVAENMFLGREPRRGLMMDWTALHRGAAELIARFGLPLDAQARVGDLGVGQKQLVEIVRALGKNSRVLVLDEPTAALTQQETDALLEILRALRRKGTACIYISHRLEEVRALADRITVLRDGATVASFSAADFDLSALIRHMVGRSLGTLFPRRAPAPANATGAAPPALSVRGLSVAPARGEPAFLREIDFELRAGEVLGIGGLMGSGRTELLMHLFGAWGWRAAGEVSLHGRALGTGHNPRTSLESGLSLVSEDRRRYGLFPEQSIGFNLSISSLRRFVRGAALDSVTERQANFGQFQAVAVRAAGLDQCVGQLSGGNQQKVVFGRVLMIGPKVILLDEPTRGIDVGAKVEIYELINGLTAAGRAVLLVSSELPELMGMSDRIVMLHEGAVAGAFAGPEFAAEQLLAAALGEVRPSAGKTAP